MTTLDLVTTEFTNTEAAAMYGAFSEGSLIEASDSRLRGAPGLITLPGIAGISIASGGRAGKTAAGSVRAGSCGATPP